MKKILYLLAALIFAALFYNQNLGINILIFDFLMLGILVYNKELKTETILSKIILSGLLISAITIVWRNSELAIVIHFINWIIFIGNQNYSKAKSIVTSIVLGLNNVIRSPKIAFVSLFKTQFGGKKGSKIKYGLYVIPILIILVFIALYRAANPVLDTYLSKIFKAIYEPFKNIDLDYLPIFILGLLLTAPILFRYYNKKIENKDIQQNDFLIRKRNTKKRFKFLDLKNEIQAGVFLLISLNIILFIVNIADVYSVWFNFSFAGQMLKDFVHKGTYMLIISILLSIAIVLYFFRKNINFYSKNKQIKKLTYFWIAQNSLLVISVFIRCYYYINNFGLAYGRIALLVFLALTLFGLLTVYLKVKDLKTNSFLVRLNVLATFILLNILTLVNWDVFIADYNVSNYKKSFVHFNYISKLSDKALYKLDLNPDILEKINKTQKTRFSFSSSKIYTSTKDYENIINNRKRKFINRWENNTDWLSWNMAEYNCYNKLTNKGN